MDTMSKSGSKSLVSIPPTSGDKRDNSLDLKQIRFRELDAEFTRQSRRLAQVMRQLKKGLNDKIG